MYSSSSDNLSIRQRNQETFDFKNRQVFLTSTSPSNVLAAGSLYFSQTLCRIYLKESRIGLCGVTLTALTYGTPIRGSVHLYATHDILTCIVHTDVYNLDLRVLNIYTCEGKLILH